MLIDKIKKDLLTARKQKDELTKGILTALVSEATMLGKNMGNRETTDTETLKVIQKFKKGAVETLGLLGASIEKICDCPTENSEKCLSIALEIGIYDKYLPLQLTEEEITKKIGVYLQDNSEKVNIGSVMAYFRKNFDGQFDGKVLAKLTNQALKEGK